MARWVFLLRGVNVGGRNKVPMAPFRDALTQAGFTDVRTYLQSGNVVATFDSDDRTEACAAMTGVLGAEFEIGVPVTARTADELAAIIEANPFPESAEQVKLLHVGFCDPAPTSTDGLDPERFAPDRFALAVGELFLDYDQGVHGSKLTNAAIERALGVTVTARNWKTVNALHELAAGGSAGPDAG